MNPAPPDLLAQVSRLPMTYGAETFGRVYLAADAVYRVVGPAGEPVLRHVVEHDLLKVLEAHGFVETEVRHLARPGLPDPSILQHRRIPFATVPGEWSPSMFLEAARLLCRLNLALDSHGLMLKDGHALNVTFDGGRPVFLDFGSLTFPDQQAQRTWLEEFRTRVLVPLWLATWVRPEILAYILKTEPRGLVWYLAKKTRLGWHLPPMMRGLRRRWRTRGWRDALLTLMDYLDRVHLKQWPPEGNAQSARRDPGRDDLILEHIERRPPGSLLVMDWQADRFGEWLAARTRLPVCSADPNIHLIEAAHQRTRLLDLPLDVAVLDVMYPTPPYGAGNSYPGAIRRLQADCVVALDLVGAFVLRRRCTMDTFAQIVADYCGRAAIVGFAPPGVVGVGRAGEAPPPDYSLEHFMDAFLRRFTAYETISRAGDEQTLVEFTR